MKHYKKFVLLVVISLFLVRPMELRAQPYACKPLIFCPGGCQENGIDCWDIDDPVPLDNGLILLIAAGMVFGIYKLNSRRSVQV